MRGSVLASDDTASTGPVERHRGAETTSAGWPGRRGTMRPGFASPPAPHYDELHMTGRTAWWFVRARMYSARGEQDVATPGWHGYVSFMRARDLPDDLPLSFTTSMAEAAGLPRRAVRDLVATGTLEQVARGIYRRADAPLVDLDLVETALRAREATLCLESALAHHELTDRIPTAIDMALPRSRRQPVTAAPVRWHRFHEETFDVGREEIELEPGLRLGVYSASRTLVDVFRLMHREGSDLAYEALRTWLRAPTTTPAELLHLARRVPHAEKPLRHALEVLL